MKWVVISTVGKNPGDEFIRVGIGHAIKAVDSKATGSIIDKESNSIFRPEPFDRCILAGMPVFWSLDGNNCWTGVKWWKVLADGWVSNDKRKFAIIGAGSFQDQTNIFRGVNKERLHKEASNLNDRSHTIIVRDDIVNKTTGMNFDVKVCPAILATYDLLKTGSINGCNMMPEGAHYGVFSPTEAGIWQSKAQSIAKELLRNDFKFFSHNDNERLFAKHLGWVDKNIIHYTGDTKAFLQHYKNVDKFFGNRVHGCIVSRANNADVISCGYDSRQEAVRLSGSKILLPSELDINKFSRWVENSDGGKPIDVDNIFDYYKDVLSEFKGE
tara:strand:- start:970 stop:1950 length:981 start_codon:yes stop_codon:yes gene_type:complete